MQRSDQFLYQGYTFEQMRAMQQARETARKERIKERLVRVRGCD